MGIEGGSGGYIDRPRIIEAKIEGKAESSSTEIDMDQAIHIPLRDITWKDFALRVKEVGTYDMSGPFGTSSKVKLYTVELEYKDKKGESHRSNLSLTTSKAKPVLFTGTTNGFYVHDPLWLGRKDPFYVVGLQVDKLEKNMSRMSSIWHELGHVVLYNKNLDTKLLKAAISLRTKDLPAVALAKKYGNELAKTIPHRLRQQKPPIVVDRHALYKLRRNNYRADKTFSLFDERNAWAAGMHIVRANEYPTGFQKPESYFEYARLCLSTYDRLHGGRKFVRGWKNQ